jgi:hypothetical protein
MNVKKKKERKKKEQKKERKRRKLHLPFNKLCQMKFSNISSLKVKDSFNANRRDYRT